MIKVIGCFQPITRICSDDLQCQEITRGKWHPTPSLHPWHIFVDLTYLSADIPYLLGPECDSLPVSRIDETSLVLWFCTNHSVSHLILMFLETIDKEGFGRKETLLTGAVGTRLNKA